MQGGAPGLDGVPDLAAPGEQDQVVRSHTGRKALDEGPAEALVGARDEIDATARELSGLPEHGGTVRLGWVPSAGTTLVPHALAALRRSDPGPHVISREGGTPALARALRAGSIDLALPASAPRWSPCACRTSEPMRKIGPGRLADRLSTTGAATDHGSTGTRQWQLFLTCRRLRLTIPH